MKKINNTSLDRSSLVWEWLLDWNANDTAGTNNGTATNVTWTAASRGYVEEVGSFNGSTSVITTSSPTTTWTSATFSFWLYKTNNVDQAYIVENNYANASHCFFDTATNKINYRFWWTNLISSTANPVVNNTWNFIQIKHEWTTWKIFINTIENASWTVNAKTSSGTGLTFWRLGQLWIYYLNWRMGNIRIHNSITSEGEDKALYKEGLRQFWPTQATTTIPVSWLVASYDYDDITLDTSGNWNDWTASNVITQKVGQQNVWAYNGSSSWIDASITTWANFSVSLSFKATNISLTARLFARWTFWNDLAIQVFQSKIRWLIWQDWSWLVIWTQSATLVSWKIYNYILSYDWANLKQYLDWVLITNDATTATIWTWAILSSFWYDTNENKEYFGWQIGLPRIYNRALTQAERTALYQEGLRQFWPTNNTTTIPVSWLVASYDADNITLDTSGSGNDWTATSVITQKVGQQNVWVYNGSSSYISIPAMTSSVKSIVFYWRKTNTSNIWRFIWNVWWTKYIGQLYTDNKFYINIWWGTKSFTRTNNTEGSFYIVTANWVTLEVFENNILVLSVADTWVFTWLDAIWRYSSSYIEWEVGLFRTYNKVLSSSERTTLNHEAKTKLSFPNYSLRNLEVGKVLEISNPQSGWSYIDQTGNGNNWTPTSVTDSTVGLNNVMSFNWTSSCVDLTWFSHALWDRTILFTAKMLNNTWTVYLFDSQTWRILISPWNWVTGSNNWSIYDWTAWRNFSVSTDVWKFHRVVIKFIWTSARLYIDWIFKSAVTYTQRAIWGSVRLWCGYDWTGAFTPMDLTKFEIDNRALSDIEIQQEYYSSKLI